MDYHSYSPYYRPKHIFKYPKFLILLVTIILAYLLLNGKSSQALNEVIASLGYVGTFLAGMMYSYGFTAAGGVAIFLILGKFQNAYIAAVIGGLGSLVADFIIFSFVRISFRDEISKLANESWLLYLKHSMPKWLKKIMLPVIGSVIIASPLPDEIGVTVLAAYKKLSIKTFTILSFVLNTLGILVILWLGSPA